MISEEDAKEIQSILWGLKKQLDEYSNDITDTYQIYYSHDTGLFYYSNQGYRDYLSPMFSIDSAIKTINYLNSHITFKK